MAPRKRPQLEGMRNVSTFLSQPVKEEASATETIPIDQIQLPQKQPRRYFDPAKLAQLTQSIQEHGILEPLLVRPLSNGSYELVAGERRLKAAQAAGITAIPIVSKTLTDREALQIALIENLQREDLNPVEETEGILELLAIELDGSKDEVISLLHRANHAKNRDQKLEDNVILQLEKVESVLATVGRFTAESFRANRLPLLNLAEDVLEALRQGKLEYTKARAIARVKDLESRQALLQQAIDNNFSLSQIRQAIADLQSAKSTEPNSLQDKVKDTFSLLRKVKSLPASKQKKLDSYLEKIQTLLTDLPDS